MSVHTPNVRRSRRVIWLLVAACGGAPTQETSPKTAPAAVKVDPPAAPAPAKPSPAPVKLATVRDDVPLPLTKLLGQPVADVQAQLGEPMSKGMVREHCVRFVPERTFFSCQYALQRYADKTDNFASVQISYEDGVATSVAFDGWKHASGVFDPQALLAAVGLTLPEAGTESAPEANVKLWSWFNGRARLVIGGKQHRVEVSVIDGEWARSRVEVVVNDPLTPAQQASIVPTGGKAVGDAAKQ